MTSAVGEGLDLEEDYVEIERCLKIAQVNDNLYFTTYGSIINVLNNTKRVQIPPVVTGNVCFTINRQTP